MLYEVPQLQKMWDIKFFQPVSIHFHSTLIVVDVFVIRVIYLQVVNRRS